MIRVESARVGVNYVGVYSEGSVICLRQCVARKKWFCGEREESMLEYTLRKERVGIIV